MIRSISEIGAMWPLCATCKHIAQCHDEGSCCERVHGHCPTCGTFQEIPCQCKEYAGPTWEEFKKRLTPEEIAYYRYDK